MLANVLHDTGGTAHEWNMKKALCSCQTYEGDACAHGMSMVGGWLTEMAWGGMGAGGFASPSNHRKMDE